jgi:hypothetical protein
MNRSFALSVIGENELKLRQISRVVASHRRRCGRGRRPRLRPASSSDRKEPPLSRHPLQEGGAVIAKAQAGAGDQVLDRA